MDSDKYPDGLPESLRPEYDKYLTDTKRYEKLYPVCFRILLKYIGTSDGKDKRQSSKQ